MKSNQNSHKMKDIEAKLSLVKDKVANVITTCVKPKVSILMYFWAINMFK